MFSSNVPLQFQYELFQPGGGQVRIENRKLSWEAAPKTVSINMDYAPSGGTKKVVDVEIHDPLL